MKLVGKTAVVAGGAVGWGAAACERLASEGAAVIILDARREQAEKVATRIAERGTGSASVEVASIDDFAQLSAVASGLEGALDILVTHYMDLDWASIEDCDIENFARVVRHDLVGPVMATKAFLPRLKASKAGSIIHIGSIDGLNGSPRAPSYSAAKGGIVPLTHVSAFEFTKYNIRVNAIATGQTLQIPADERQTGNFVFKGFPGGDYMGQLNEATPLKREGSLFDWAGPVAFLASDDASHMTGSVVLVDCGRLAITPGTA
jgi:NAD(P)-dependent dehydrogenase (short-subunit alcohol dehydrogenase family)